MLALFDLDEIQVVLEEAHVARPVQCVASGWDYESPAAAAVPKTYAAATSGTTAVRVVRGRGTSVRRSIEYMSFFNADTVNHTVTVSIVLSGVSCTLAKVTLGSGERLEYGNGSGFTVLNAAGAARTIATGTQNVVSAGRSVALLAADVVNNNAVANTLQDVVGLSFPVVAEQRYWFRFCIQYTAVATTTGSRWTINGPSTSELRYRSEYSLSATTRTLNEGLSTYGVPAAANASSAAVAVNIAVIEGFVVPSVDGDVIARFASEIASSAITAKQGSFVEYMAL